MEEKEKNERGDCNGKAETARTPYSRVSPSAQVFRVLAFHLRPVSFYSSSSSTSSHTQHVMNSFPPFFLISFFHTFRIVANSSSCLLVNGRAFPNYRKCLNLFSVALIRDQKNICRFFLPQLLPRNREWFNFLDCMQEL